jgi:hypothetical protein
MVKLNPKIIKKVENRLKKCGVEDLQTIDLKGEWDSSLSVKENYSLLEEKYHLTKRINRQERLDDITKFKEQQEKEEYEKVKIAFNEALKKLPVETRVIQTLFNPIKEYSQILVEKDSKVFGLIITGDAGIGKSFQTLKSYASLGLEEGKDFVYFQSYTTPVELVNLFWDNRDNKIIILDDVEGLFKDSKAINILKSVLWSSISGERFCEYHTTSTKLRSPSKFLFTSKIIIITNRIDKENDEHIRSLKSRCFVLNIQLTFEEKILLMYDIAKNVSSKLCLEERENVVDYFKECGLAVKNFDFRLLIKALFLREKKPEKWKVLVDEMMEVDEDMLYAIKIRDEITSVRNEKWVENTGYSVRKLQMVLKELNRRMGKFGKRKNAKTNGF